MKKKITFNLPVQNELNIKEYNKIMAQAFPNFIPQQTKDEAIQGLIKEITESIDKFVEKGDLGDFVEINVTLELKQQK